MTFDLSRRRVVAGILGAATAVLGLCATASAAESFSDTYGYSPAVKANGLVFISGVFGAEQDGTVPKDPEKQFRLAFAELGNVLKAQGLGPEDIVEMTSFHVLYPQHMDAFMKAKTEFLHGNKPAWTAIGAAALGTPETLVEIKAVAKAR
jgi:enamine deaminase RidA (YjgF/YER057c/UK114 family)